MLLKHPEEYQENHDRYNSIIYFDVIYDHDDKIFTMNVFNDEKSILIDDELYDFTASYKITPHSKTLEVDLDLLSIELVNYHEELEIDHETLKKFKTDLIMFSSGVAKKFPYYEIVSTSLLKNVLEFKHVMRINYILHSEEEYFESDRKKHIKILDDLLVELMRWLK